MDLQSTPQATQPYFDPRRGEVSTIEAPPDHSDIILFLHPTSETAIEAVRTTAGLSPQHVRQLSGFGHIPDDDLISAAEQRVTDPFTEPMLRTDREATESTQFQETPVITATYDNELALRFSSDVRDINLGFLFGRNEKDCDVVFKQDHKRIKVSGIHFRIYVSDDGVVMIEDCSTNGTFLDGTILLRTGQKRVLSHATKIEVVIFTDSKHNYQERATFLVAFPMRDEAGDKRYAENFAQYKQRRQAKLGIQPKNGARTTSNAIGFGNSRFTHGMHWNGAPKYSVLGQIGKGAFATVFRIATRSEGAVYAAKEIQKGKISNRNLDEKIENEIDVMKRITHPHVIQLYESHDIGSHLYLILEYMPEGDLLGYFHKNGCLNEVMAQSVTKQICHALSFCHACLVTHRDIKPENILIQSFDPLMVKLSDFGLSKVIDEEGGAAMRTFCGTMLYCAPEVYPDYMNMTGHDPRPRKDDHNSPRYKSNVDIWSLGAVMFHLIAGEPPFEGRSGVNGTEMLKVVLNKIPGFAMLSKTTSESGVSFLQSCLRVDNADRPDAVQCLQLEWLKDVPDVVLDLPPPPDPLRKTAIEIATSNALGIRGLPNRVVESTDSLMGAVGGPDDHIVPSEGIEGSLIEDPDGAIAFLDYHQPDPISDEDGVDAPGPVNNGLDRPKLFGEVGPAGADSGIFGATEKPVIIANGAGEKTEVTTPEGANGTISDESAALHSTISHVQDMTIDSPSHLSVQAMPPPPSASFLKRHREEDSSADTLAKTSKRLVTHVKSKINGKTNGHSATSNGMSKSSRSGPVFGKLVPVTGSIPEARDLILRGPVSAWGRHPSVSHVWPHPGDTRIPKAGMDLVFWSPSAAEFSASSNIDWVKVDLARDAGTIPAPVLDDLEPYLKTRGSLVLNVAKAPLSKAGSDDKWKVIRLRDGDIVEIFPENELGEKLQYKCQFFVGKGKKRRGFGEVPVVEHAEALQVWSEELNARRSTEHQVLTT